MRQVVKTAREWGPFSSCSKASLAVSAMFSREPLDLEQALAMQCSSKATRRHGDPLERSRRIRVSPRPRPTQADAARSLPTPPRPRPHLARHSLLRHAPARPRPSPRRPCPRPPLHPARGPPAPSAFVVCRSRLANAAGVAAWWPLGFCADDWPFKAVAVAATPTSPVAAPPPPQIETPGIGARDADRCCLCFQIRLR